MYQFVINKEDLKNISLILANNQLFIPSFISDRVDIYNPITYLQSISLSCCHYCICEMFKYNYRTKYCIV